MQANRDDLLEIVHWVNVQFHSNNSFPSTCVDVDSSITVKHLQAYKEWSSTPATLSGVSQWISDWLSTDEIQALKQGLDHKHHHSKSA